MTTGKTRGATHNPVKGETDAGPTAERQMCPELRGQAAGQGGRAQLGLGKQRAGQSDTQPRARRAGWAGLPGVRTLCSNREGTAPAAQTQREALRDRAGGGQPVASRVTLHSSAPVHPPAGCPLTAPDCVFILHGRGQICVALSPSHVQSNCSVATSHTRHTANTRGTE